MLLNPVKGYTKTKRDMLMSKTFSYWLLVTGTLRKYKEWVAKLLKITVIKIISLAKFTCIFFSELTSIYFD